MNLFIKKLIVLIKFLGFYTYDITYSAFLIAWDVITIKNHSSPGIIKMPLDAKTDFEVTLVANLITFSPGTMVIDVDEENRFLWVHVMFLHKEADKIRELKEQLEYKVLEVLRWK